MQRTTKIFFLPILVGMLAILGLLLVHPAQTSALSGGQFKAGNIIDDGIFFNRNSMSVQQIQNFLNSKVPSCDTWGAKMYSSSQTRAQYGASKGNPAPYTCLRDYVQDTPSKPAENQLCGAYGGGRKTSAQMIYDVAQICNINPQVLLVLLQKEQSLITDDWPWSIQYRSATGYGCPDTAPCDAEYYGFFNQVYNAGRIYKKYARDAQLYNYRAGRNNTILYNPNRACGSSNVYIQNQATAGLYVYTPYQPNQAALNNLYGTGDGCSAYGNRNFWRMFNDWFGSTHGSLIRTVSSGALYYTDGARKFTVSSMELVAQYGLGAGDVRFVSQQELDSIPNASSPFSSSLGQIIKSNDDADADGGALYLVNNGSRIPIASMDQFTELGFTSSSIRYLPLQSIERLSLSPKSLSNFIQASDLSVWKIEQGKRRAIFELSKLSQLNPSGNITPLTEFNAYTWPFGKPLVDDDFMIIGPDNGIRLYRDSSFYSVPSMSVYDCWKLNSGVKTFRVGAYYILESTSKGNLSCVGKNSANTTYLMVGSQRHGLPGDQGLTTSNPSDYLVNRLPEGSLKPVVSNSRGELAVIEGTKKRPIPTMAVFSQLGFNGNSIQKIPDAAYASMPAGARKLSVGTIMKETSGALSVVNSPNSRLTIPSMQMFEHYAFQLAPMVTVNSTDLSAYPSQGSLSYYVQSDSTLYMIDKRVRYRVDQTLDTHIGVNRSGVPTVGSGVISYTLPWNMSRFIKSDNKNDVYYLENGKKRTIPSWQHVVSLGGESKIVVLSEFRVNQFPSGPSM